MSRFDHGRAPHPADVFGHFEGKLDQTDPHIIRGQADYGLRLEEQGYTFFNNFVGYLPGGAYRRLFELYPDLLNDPFVLPSELEETGRLLALGISQKATEVTRREFLEHVDSAIADAQLDEEEIARLQQDCERTHASREDSRAAHLGRLLYILPVYQKLREQGYSHGDLYR